MGNGKSSNVTGSPTQALLESSFTAKFGLELNDTNLRSKSSEEDYDLYVPHTSDYDGCSGYWLASPGDTLLVWRVSCLGYVGDISFDHTSIGARPVVILTSDISVMEDGEGWKVTN